MWEVAPSVGGGATTDRTQAAPTTGVPAETAQFLGLVLQASRDRDPLGLQAQLDLAAAGLGLDRCIDDILMPAIRELRLLLQAGLRDVAQELMATEAVRTWLNHRGSLAPAPRAIEPILLACGPRDRQMVGLESLAVLLKVRRWPCRLLGARTSTFTLTVAARAADAAGVVVMSADGRGRPHAIASLRAVGAMGIPVFFAGDAFESDVSREQVPGRYLGSTIEGACSLLVTALAPDVQRRTAAGSPQPGSSEGPSAR